MARVTLPALCALLGPLVLAVPRTLALPTYRRQAAQLMHYDQDTPLWALDRRVVPCTFCHVEVTGGPPWNVFGEEIRAAFTADARAGRHRPFPQVLQDLLASGADADRDGYADVLEVFARTLPGDPSSRPGEPPEQVMAAFEHAGGMRLYQAKRPEQQ
ncbi:hypothetical protein [Deinococcus sonorensis]|uniref:Cytochrome c domain-containing protein n=2 Tax=Deinococcus sonorensis TaxID=309891 RepID=A0AAU7U5G1_9DEIO